LLTNTEFLKVFIYSSIYYKNELSIFASVKDLLRIFRYIRPYSKYAFLNIFFNILYILFSFFNLALFIPFINILFNNVKSTSIERPPLGFDSHSIIANFNYFLAKIIEDKSPYHALLFISVFFIVFSFLNNLFKYLGMYFLAPIRNGMVKDLRNDVFEKLLILPLSFYSERKKGDIITRLSSDINEIEWSVVSSLQMLVKDPLNVIFFAIVLIFISPQLVFYSLIILIPAGFLINIVGKSLKRNSERGQRELSNIVTLVEESINGLRILKSFNVIDFAIEKFAKVNKNYSRILARILRRREAASPLTETLAVLGLMVVILIGGSLVISKKISPDILIFFVIIFGRMIPPAQSMITAFYNIQRGRISAKRIFEILDAQEVIVEKENAIPFKSFEKEIEFKNVSFYYSSNPDKKVLNSINLKITKGQIIAIVGASGVGKSTLVDLIPRFYDCTEGEILIDGINIKDYVISDVRGQVGLVSQDTILFNDTVFNNIAFGTNNTEEDVIRAAKIANAHEFIEKMPNGYYSFLSDRGLNLSGGQRQRLSLARAILKDPSILILDEATSALDTQSEKYVQDALLNVMKNRTTIVIAHRLSTIQNADLIVVMDNGKIVETGTHSELLNRNGIYKQFIQIQQIG
jgi:subfamily B ATP-binding cassette protein MsbA